MKSALYNIDFLKKPHSFKMFSAYNKIKADLSELPCAIDINYIKYYQTNFRYENIYADKIYQIDIKSCYASLLRNAGLISPETFEYISECSKDDRLAATGMLASRKNQFFFDATGEINAHNILQNEYSDFFFWCVQETYKLMNECKEILGDSFLFIWVDAIYFNGDWQKANQVVNYFQSVHRLESSINVLEEFEVELKKDFYRCRFFKDGHYTFMDIPTPEQSEKTELLNHLLNIKRKKYEKKRNPFKRKSAAAENNDTANNNEEIPAGHELQG